MRRSFVTCGSLAAGMVLTGMSSASHAAAGPVAAPAPTSSAASAPTVPAALSARTRIARWGGELDGRAGRVLRVRGRVLPARRGVRVELQLHSRAGWQTVARDLTARTGVYDVRMRPRVPLSSPARLRVPAGRGVKGAVLRAGRMNVYRVATASWYGPGLFGNRTGCGGRLHPRSLGVAHKRLPCGTPVTVRHDGRRVRVTVIDRGPYVAGREFDLTSATARQLNFRGYGPVLVTR